MVTRILSAGRADIAGAFRHMHLPSKNMIEAGLAAAVWTALIVFVVHYVNGICGV